MFLTTNRVYVDCYLWSCLKITITLKYNTNKEGLKTLSLIFNGSNSTVKSLVTLYSKANISTFHWKKLQASAQSNLFSHFWTLFVKSHLHNAFIQKIQMMSFWVSDKNSYGSVLSKLTPCQFLASKVKISKFLMRRNAYIFWEIPMIHRRNQIQERTWKFPKPIRQNTWSWLIDKW